jgi:hypothetical protein
MRRKKKYAVLNNGQIRQMKEGMNTQLFSLAIIILSLPSTGQMPEETAE